MNLKRLTEVVLVIREYATTKKFNICHRVKTINWACQMLNLLSDEVIYNYLITLHPFQFMRGNDATQVYEFRVGYYRHSAFIRVNLRQREVLSFHYDEALGDAGSEPKDTKDSYYYAQEENDATAMFSEIAVIPETTSFGVKGWICRFAVGSQITTVPIYPNFQEWHATIPLQEYYDAIQSTARGFQTQYIKKVIDSAEMQNSTGVRNYNSDNLVQLTNCGIDLCNKFPAWYRAKDLTIDLLMQLPPQVSEAVRDRLHDFMYALPDLPASQETLLEDWDEE